MVEQASDAGAPAPRVVVERPPPGLARGSYAWPAWGIGVLGGVIAALGLAFVIWRLTRRRLR